MVGENLPEIQSDSRGGVYSPGHIMMGNLKFAEMIFVSGNSKDYGKARTAIDQVMRMLSHGEKESIVRKREGISGRIEEVRVPNIPQMVEIPNEWRINPQQGVRVKQSLDSFLERKKQGYVIEQKDVDEIRESISLVSQMELRAKRTEGERVPLAREMLLVQLSLLASLMDNNMHQEMPENATIIFLNIRGIFNYQKKLDLEKRVLPGRFSAYADPQFPSVLVQPLELKT